MERLNINELYKLMLDYFGYKLSAPRMNPEKGEIAFILYESFVFKISIDKRYGIFGAALVLGEEFLVLSLFGENIAINNDLKSITMSFEKIDNYCKLRLPDKFLVEYNGKLMQS